MQNRFSPFDHFDLDPKKCFLTGAPAAFFTPVFPEWMIERYGLQSRSVALPDGQPLPYAGITLPCCQNVAEAISGLHEDMQAVYDAGFSGVKKADPVALFRFHALILYGFIWHELRAAIRQESAAGSQFGLSHTLLQKFANLHLMLQSLVRNTEFEEPYPWTMVAFPVSGGADDFVFRDEISTLFLSIRTGSTGILFLMLDAGLNEMYHRGRLKMIGENSLHPIQFEELNALFLYSAYLMQKPVGLSVMDSAETTFIEAEPVESIGGRPVFESWIDKTYAQVLENFWKPWQISQFEIRKDPDNTLSFLTGENGSFLPPEKIPY
ncbi:MAG: hypothetical protein INR69_17650 [Mucilaginibacter polytrichastri]|nr:hypothetical protein [Mucilaginibacter polytrichastri]